MKHIPILKSSLPSSKKIFECLEPVIDSGIIAEGDYVYKFEELFTNKFKYQNGIATSSGTAALHMALLSLGSNDGDEVITTPMTAEPTNLSILQSGLKPIFADIDINTGNIDPSSVESKITKKTKAIMVVHYAGYPADMVQINKIAKKHKLAIIEDCAHSIGALINNKYVGKFSDFSIFSFQAVKHITTFDGGFLLFRDNKLHEKLKRLRWFGLLKGADRTKPSITDIGFKYNMSNISAALGILQIDRIDSIIESNRRCAEFYDTHLNNFDFIKLVDIKNTFPTYWLYTIKVENSDDFIKYLNKNYVGASKVHIPNNYHPIFKDNALPNTDIFYEKLVHIPCGSWVSDSDLNYILQVIKNYAASI